MRASYEIYTPKEGLHFMDRCIYMGRKAFLIKNKKKREIIFADDTIQMLMKADGWKDAPNLAPSDENDADI